jgi:hypothetical protein
MLINDPGNVTDLDLLVHNTLRIHQHAPAKLADTQATGGVELEPAPQFPLTQFICESLCHFDTSPVSATTFGIIFRP